MPPPYAHTGGYSLNDDSQRLPTLPSNLPLERQMSIVAIQWRPQRSELPRSPYRVAGRFGRMRRLLNVTGPCSKPDQCEGGYAAITRDDAQHAPMTVCLAGPDYCKTNSDCASGYACEKNTGTSAPKGSGVCMPDTVAVLQQIE